MDTDDSTSAPISRQKSVTFCIVLCTVISLIGAFWISRVETRIPVSSVELADESLYAARGILIEVGPDQAGGSQIVARREFQLDLVFIGAITGLLVGLWVSRKVPNEVENVAEQGGAQ